MRIEEILLHLDLDDINQLFLICFSLKLLLEIGVVLGGKRENKIDERVTFQIEPEMLQNVDYVGNNQFKLLPEDYYSLSDNLSLIHI